MSERDVRSWCGVALLVSLVCALPSHAAGGDIARVKEFVARYYAGEAPFSALAQSTVPLNPLTGPATVARLGPLQSVRVLGSSPIEDVVFRMRMACGAARLTVIDEFDAGSGWTMFRIVPGEESIGDIAEHPESGEMPDFVKWLAEGAPGGVDSFEEKPPFGNDVLQAGAAVAMQLCAGAQPVALGATSLATSRGKKYRGNVMFERGVVSFNITMTENGVLQNFWTGGVTEDERQREAADGDVSIDEQEIMREKLDSASTQLTRSHARLTATSDGHYDADAAAPLLEFSREATAEAFDAPSLAGAKRVVSTYVNRITANVERVTVGDVAVMAKEAVDRAIDGTLKLWRRYRDADDLSPDLTFASTPKHAKVVIQVGEDEKTKRQTETDDALANVWLGVYDASLTLGGYDNVHFVIDLVNDSRTKIRCRLAPKSSKDASRCRQFMRDEEEPADE